MKTNYEIAEEIVRRSNHTMVLEGCKSLTEAQIKKRILEWEKKLAGKVETHRA